ncbi:MAG: hypothetical protein KC620_03645 [Myxococcales bacterium]|nr:hypothetical protein [Myxococcales bacterium]
MVRARSSWWLLFILLLSAAGAHARNPADAFKGRIVLSTKPFPARFSSDARFISHMKSVDTKHFAFAGTEEEEGVNVEFMAFFARPYTATEFTGTIYDTTEGQRMVTSFPVYPNQRETRILASFMKLDKASFPDEDRQYLFVITHNTRVIAETKFVIKESPQHRADRQAEERALRKGSVVNF